MRELEKHNPDSHKQIKQAEIKKQHNLLGSFKKIRGLTLFQMDVTTGKISKAKFEQRTVEYVGQKKRNKLIAEENCLYVQALNFKNAKKKFTKKVKQLIAQKHD
jgi:hypothetical protein